MKTDEQVGLELLAKLINAKIIKTPHNKNLRIILKYLAKKIKLT